MLLNNMYLFLLSVVLLCRKCFKQHFSTALAFLLILLTLITPLEYISMEVKAANTFGIRLETEPAIVLSVAGQNSYSYKSGAKDSKGFPAWGISRKTNAGSQRSGGVQMWGYGDDGVTQSDTTGTWTVPWDGTYRVELQGGSGAGAILDCEPGHKAQGGLGGTIQFEVTLKKGDVVTYTVANGGVPMCNVKSYCGYEAEDLERWEPDEWTVDGHTVIGADGRDTIFKVNGVEYARAYGGDGGVRSCIRDFYYWTYKVYLPFVESRGLLADGIKTKGFTTKHSPDSDSIADRYKYDDPAIGGKGGSTSYNSSKVTLLAKKDGNNGKANGGLSSPEPYHTYGFMDSAWMATVRNPEWTQGPGYMWIEFEHEHQFPTSNSTCTEAGTGSVTCSICGGVTYGVTPPHGHNFQPVEMSETTKCNKDQLYYEKAINSPSNNKEVPWDGRDHWWYAYQCQYCKQYAEPYTGYNVRYNEGSGPQKLDPQLKQFGTTYTPYTQPDVGWTRRGYYLAYWEYRVPKDNYTCKDKDWPAGKDGLKATYKDLPANNEWIVDLYAVWKPIPYVLRVHENFAGQKYGDHKDYQVTWDQKFQLPQPLWKHDALCYGYSLNPDVKVGQQWRCGQYTSNMTELVGLLDKNGRVTAPTGDPRITFGDAVNSRNNPIVDIYTIWDLPPTITLKTPEIHLSDLKVAAGSLGVNNGTISRSDLEAELMTYATATDYEWTCRYPGTIPPGEKNGYSFKIASFEPAKVKDHASNNDADTYYVTFQVTDDANQSATAVLTLYVGKHVDILVH